MVLKDRLMVKKKPKINFEPDRFFKMGGQSAVETVIWLSNVAKLVDWFYLIGKLSTNNMRVEGAQSAAQSNPAQLTFSPRGRRNRE